MTLPKRLRRVARNFCGIFCGDGIAVWRSAARRPAAATDGASSKAV